VSSWGWVPSGSRGLTRGVFGLLSGLPFRRLQGLLDQPQDEVPLGEFPAGPGGLPLQVRLDPIEQFFRDLEGQGPAVVVCHDFVTSIFLHFEVFG